MSLGGAHRHIISDTMLNLKTKCTFVFIKHCIFFCAQTLRLLGEFLDLESSFFLILLSPLGPL